MMIKKFIVRQDKIVNYYKEVIIEIDDDWADDEDECRWAAEEEAGNDGVDWIINSWDWCSKENDDGTEEVHITAEEVAAYYGFIIVKDAFEGL